MSLAELLKKDLVRKSEPDRNQALELLASAERDLKAANDNLASSNYDWALAISYNSMLSSGRALMANKGYIPVTEAHHLAVVRFCDAVLQSKTNFGGTFNKYRVRRHNVVYGAAGSVGREEAETSIKNAELFYKCIRGTIK
ncbi:MAG: HEPN domain-containing protein [Candidatus Micrarchaeota archaeon]